MLQSDHAIAWGQAMFLGGGNVIHVHRTAQGLAVMGRGPGGLGLVLALERIKESATPEVRHRTE